jgi:hypothetical protein
MIGEIVYLFAFDVANEILTAKVGKILGKVAEPLDIRRDHTSPRDIPIHRPLAVEPGVLFSCDGKPLRVQVRIYDVGVVSVLLRVPFERDKIVDLTPFHRATLSDGRDFGAAAREICGQVVVDLAGAMPLPSKITEPEAYTVFCVTHLGEIDDVPVWSDGIRREIAGLLTDMDPVKLSASQIDEIFRHRQSFEKSDLVVLDWDAALVVDLSGYVDDVLYVIELANLQLEEFRVMDEALDRQLNRTYPLVEQRPGFWIATPSTLLRQLRSLSVDYAKLADEVTHITKFLGDWYLARVYLSARERFHLEQWRTSVEQRIGQLNDLYSVVRAEVNERRMLWLEIIIVVFFAIDILLIFVKK